MKKKGISLITLVITIVVVIILAAAVILSLGRNNPIQTSRVATLLQTRDSLQSGILVYLGNVQAKTLGNYATEEILAQNETYKIAESTKITVKKDGEDLDIYKLEPQKVKSSLNIEITEGSKDAWYIDKNGVVYLAYEDLSDIPEYYKESGSISSSLSSFVISKNQTFTEILIPYDNISSGSFGIYTRVDRNIPEEKTIASTGLLYLRDGTLDLNSSVSEANNVLTLNNTSSSVVRKTITTKITNIGGYGLCIIDKNFGVWVRGYAVLSDGTVVYGNSKYCGFTNLDMKSENISNNKIKFNLSRDVVSSARDILNSDTPVRRK